MIMINKRFKVIVSFFEQNLSTKNIVNNLRGAILLSFKEIFLQKFQFEYIPLDVGHAHHE